MSLERLLTIRCTITRVAVSADDTDEYGNPTDTERTVETCCYLEQRTRSEDTVDRDTQTEQWLLAFPAPTTVDGGDHVDVAGYGEFEIEGPPWPVHNPRLGHVSHIECWARRSQ